MPDWNEYVRRHLPPLGLRPERECEIAIELAGQLEQAYQEALAAGLTQQEAEARARGNIVDWDALAGELRAAESPASSPLPTYHRGGWFSGLLHDVRYALRTLRLNPVFAAVAILTLAFGIGGNTAIFTVVDHLVLRGLPYPEAHRLMDLEHTKADQPEIDPWCSIDNFYDFRKRTQAFETLAGVSPIWNVVLSGDGDTERLESLYVSAEFFPMLGVRPALGRLFTAGEDTRGRPSPAVILSHGFWTRRFGNATDIIGRALHIDGTVATVVGVLPRDFRWRGEPLAGSTSEIDLWMPLASNQLARSARTLRFLKVTGRLKPGVTVDQGRDEIRRIGDALTAEFPDANRNLAFHGVPLESKLSGRLRPAVYLLIGTVGFVLLMASANVANLLLARAAARQREIAVRIAIGASAPRLIRQLLTESTVLAVCGGLLGTALASVFLRLILAYGPPAMVRTVPISIDIRALVFTAVVVLVTAILAGLAPAWRAISGAIAGPLRESRGATSGNRRLRSTLAVAQVGIALVLLIGAGLLIRSFIRVLALDPGFDAPRVVSISTQMPPGMNSPAQRTAVYQAIRDRLLATPGVQSVGAVSRLPMLGLNLSSLLIIEGQENTGHPPEVEFRAADPNYFTTMGIPLKAGRLFDDRDPSDLPVLLIDDVTARRYFPAGDAVGKRIRFLADRQGPWFTVIGIVGSTRHFGLEAEPRATIYRPAVLNPLGSPIFVIRTVENPEPLIQTLAHIVRSAYGNMPAYNVYAMQALVERSTAERRFLMWLLTCFAAASAMLAGLGIYGAISQSVAQRRREIGVRIALGASPRDTLRMVFREGMSIAIAGAAIGVVVGLATARVGRNLLYGIPSGDLLVFTVAPLVLLAFAAAGCYLPARRATQVDPLVTLRDS